MTTKPPSFPFARSYWAAPGRLLAGCYPGDAIPAEARLKLAALVRSGVRRVVNLMELNEVNWQGKPFIDYTGVLEEVAQQAGQKVCVERISIRDNNVPSVGQMTTILDAIDQGIDAGEVVYVHCWGGKGRTGTVVGCFLARHGQAVGDAVLTRLNELVQHKIELFGRVPQTPAQCDFVCNWRLGQ